MSLMTSTSLIFLTVGRSKTLKIKLWSPSSRSCSLHRQERLEPFSLGTTSTEWHRTRWIWFPIRVYRNLVALSKLDVSGPSAIVEPFSKDQPHARFTIQITPRITVKHIEYAVLI